MSQDQTWAEQPKENNNKGKHNCHSKDLKLAPSKIKRA